MKFLYFFNQLFLFLSFLLCKIIEFLNLIGKHFLSLFEFIFNLLDCGVKFVLDVNVQILSNLNSLIISSFKWLIIAHNSFFSFNRRSRRSRIHRSGKPLLLLFLFFFLSSFHFFQSCQSSSLIKFSHLFKFLICLSMLFFSLLSQLFTFSF